jgi:hypothetical protein
VEVLVALVVVEMENEMQTVMMGLTVLVAAVVEQAHQHLTQLIVAALVVMAS